MNTPYEELRAAILHLRSAAKNVVMEKYPHNHADTCHCCFCELLHALSATSGFDETHQEILKRDGILYF